MSKLTKEQAIKAIRKLDEDNGIIFNDHYLKEITNIIDRIEQAKTDGKDKE